MMAWWLVFFFRSTLRFCAGRGVVSLLSGVLVSLTGGVFPLLLCCFVQQPPTVTEYDEQVRRECCDRYTHLSVIVLSHNYLALHYLASRAVLTCTRGHVLTSTRGHEFGRLVCKGVSVRLAGGCVMPRFDAFKHGAWCGMGADARPHSSHMPVVCLGCLSYAHPFRSSARQVLNKDITRVLTTILMATTVCTIYNAALFTNLAIQVRC